MILNVKLFKIRINEHDEAKYMQWGSGSILRSYIVIFGLLNRAFVLWKRAE